MHKIRIELGRWQDGKSRQLEDLSKVTLIAECEKAIDDYAKDCKCKPIMLLDKSNQLLVWDDSCRVSNLIASYDIRRRELTVL